MAYYIEPEIKVLFEAIHDWIIGYEPVGERNKPILRADAPPEIVKKRDEFFELVLNTKRLEGQ
ncbi:MAG: hypothetical protein J6K80_00075 [Oscillospiraceae bacterium]|nr:hypothetical protein [Oscillospiraceae bacterium]